MRRHACLLALCAAHPVGAADRVIQIVGFAYEPPQLIVSDEDRVTIEASGTHPLLGDDGSFSCVSDCIVDLPPGVHGFHCASHGGPGSGMAGTITVVAATLFADGFEAP